MTQTIHRLYESRDTAAAAAQALLTSRFDRFTEVHVFTGEPAPEALVDAMTRAFILKSHAHTLADQVRRGAALVTVHAPFGTAVAAMGILESFGPVGAGVPDFTEPPLAWDEAAPLSSALHLAVLARQSGPYDGYGGMPLLTRSQSTTSGALGLPELTRSSGSYRGVTGLPLLSNKATPLSSMIGLPVLTRSRPRASKR
jgi:hypothetical protein